MNRNSCAKRLLSLLLCLTLILGLLPNVALAADADGVRYQENADVAVTYDDVDRTHATVRYHKPGAQVDSYNIIFLVDTSVQGKDSFESFEKMMVESGSDTIFDSTSNNLVSLINYTTTAETNRVNNDGIYALMSQVIHGAGTANEITALDAALAEVKSLKNSERSSYPTIVFWVLGKELVEVGNAAFESKLKALHDALNMDGSADTDALITWQLGTDTPNELLKQYATEYTGTHDSVPAKAAYASSNAAAFRKAMRDGLENIAYDHYHDLTYKLELSESNNGTSIVKKVTDVYVESARGSSQIMATPSKDNKSVAVQIEHLRRQTDYDIVFELDLNADVYEAQTVLQGITIDAQSAGQSGGVHTGVFDELTANLSTTFPEAVVDRAYRDISFDLNGGTGDAVEPIKALPGQRVVLPDGRGLARGDESFGGWNAADTADQGKIYRPGSVLEMPENGMELKAAYGHMEVELDVEKVATSTLDNHLDYVKPPRYSQMNGILTSVIPTSYWAKIVGIYVDDRTFNRYSYNKSTREVDVNTLVADDLSIVAAWHLGTIQDDIDSRVIGYLTPNGNYYDLHIAGPDGVIAPENSAGLFEHPLDQNFYERVTTIHLDALNTENVKDTVTTSFSDVSEDAWYYTAVNALASLGIVRGIGNSKFEPERSITRAEFTAIATRFAKADNRNALKFRDVSTDDWFYGCVLTAVNYGWITGMDEYTFQPNEKISRAQAAAIVNRMLARSADQSYTNNENVRRFPDVPTSHWAFYQVMEASNGHGHSYDKNGSEIWTELYEASSKAS